MNELEKLIAERLGKIEGAKVNLSLIAKSLEQALYDALVLNYEDILTKFSTFYSVYKSFADVEMIPLIDEIVTTLIEINVWNKEFFQSQQIAKVASISKKVETRLFDVFGLKPDATVIKNGYIDNLIMDSSVKNKIGNMLVRESIATRSKPIALKELSGIVRGTPQQTGAYRQFLDMNVFDRLQEADRITQVVYGEELNLQAALYVGGTIEGSRPFCKARSGKVFTLAEIKKFGTSQDKYGGYSDKSSGMFDGKPKSGYNPLLQAGGYACRHTFGFVTNFAALKARSDLKEVNGKLIIQS